MRILLWSEAGRKIIRSLSRNAGRRVVCFVLAFLVAIVSIPCSSRAATNESGQGDTALEKAEQALQEAEKERDDLIQRLENARKEKEEAYRLAQESLCKRLTPADCKTIAESFAKIIMYTGTGYSLVQMGPILGLTFLVQMLAVTEALDELAIKPDEMAELEKAKLEVNDRKVELKEIDVKLGGFEDFIKNKNACSDNEWAAQEVGKIASQAGKPGKPRAERLKLALPKDQYVKANESITFSVGVSGGTPPYSIRIYSPVSAFEEITTILEAGKNIYNTNLKFYTPGTYSVQVTVDDDALPGKQLDGGSVAFFVLESEKPSSELLVDFQIDPSSKTLQKGDTQKFEAYGTFADKPDTPIKISDKVTWYPDQEFKAKEEGVFNLGASYKGKSATVVVTVTGKEKSETSPKSGDLVSLKIDPASITMQPGQTQKFEAYGTFADKPDTPIMISDKVTWYPDPVFDAKETGVFNIGASYKGKSVNVVVTVKDKDSQGQGTQPSGPASVGLTAELDCGGSFELTPGDFAGRGCGIVVRGWRSNTEDRVEVQVVYSKSSGIEIFPGDTSVPPSLMYTAGTTDYYDRYVFSESFNARDDATKGITTITLTVSQKGAGKVSLTLRVAVLAKGQLPSTGPGIRPPAQVATGSSGTFCVWRYKIFGDPPPCFHFVAAVCGKYGPPDYELVGDRMTWGEADARVNQLSRYFDDQYGCSGAATQPTKPPETTAATPPPPPPPAACIYTYSDWSDCRPDNTKDRTVISKTPEGCEGTPVLVGPCTYTPPAPVLTRFGVYCSPNQIDQNGVATCRATGEYSNAIGTYVDLTAWATWANGPTFEGKGKSAGSYPVTATLEGASDTATVTVMKGYDPTKDSGIPGTDKPVDPDKIKGSMDGFAAGSGQGTRPGKSDQQTPIPIPTDYTKRPDQPGTTTTPTTTTTTPTPATTPTTPTPATTTTTTPTTPTTPAKPPTPTTPPNPTTPPQPTKPGIDVTVVGTAPAGKCTIVNGQLVAVKGYKENISGMTIVLTGPTSMTTTSSGGGAFSFSNIPAGKYVISVKQWNYGMTKAEFVCESGKAVKVVMKGSCPYLYVWNGKAFEKENDIYSVARLLPQDLLMEEPRLLAEKQKTTVFLFSPEHITEEVIRDKSMRDYYRITNPFEPDADGNYRLKIVEQATEHSFTDWAQLMAVDHRKDRKIGISREGQLFMYEVLQPLSSFQKPASLYNGEFIEIKLPSEAFQKGILSIDWQGFQDGEPKDHTAASGQPKLNLQRQDPEGNWQTVDWVYPRDEMQVSFFLLKDLGPDWDKENKIRIVASSCEPEKFHRVDRLAWGEVLSELPRLTYLSLISAIKGTGEDALDTLSQKDGKALFLGPQEEATLIFKGKPQEQDMERSFIFASEGFYIPMPLIRMAER